MFDFDFDDLDCWEEDQLVGRWTYIGRRGPTEYEVSRSPSSRQLLFRGPGRGGALLEGGLERRGRWLQASLAAAGGEEAGCLRLRFEAALSAALSQFRPAGAAKWGRGIVAQRLRGPREEAPEKDGFSVHAGYISAGGDLLVEELTLAAAKARCRRMIGCRGFCFQALGEDGVAKVYFKNKWDPVDDPLSGWTALRFHGPFPGASSGQSRQEAPRPERTPMADERGLPGEALDEEFIGELAKSRFNELHVFKTPVAVGGDRKKAIHQIVILQRGDVGIQLEWFIGGVRFQRKNAPEVHRAGACWVGWVQRSFEGAGLSEVLSKWLNAEEELWEKGDTTCISFAMELVEAAGAMSQELKNHFQAAQLLTHGGGVAPRSMKVPH